jgi:hypothetical protein
MRLLASILILGSLASATVQDSLAQSGISGVPTLALLDPNMDSDGDGMTNGAESVAGTNPRDANSVFKITNVTRTTLTFSSVVGRRYDLEMSQYGDQIWLITGGQITATSTTTTIPFNPTPGTFYRVGVSQ